ncbi:MAG: hypothetical protein M1834_002353 [Cirrosporium novae-zelandiae]|nr:MAG: hypothetical protein M1834_002353 [Cirrosporium novae-zelandiae]
MSRPVSPNLEPPRKSVELEDPGAHELSGSEVEEDHFEDAFERPDSTSRPTSPIPKTRVEKVDDVPSHGEVPGTPAYDMRVQDAVPDEMEVVPEGSRSRSASWVDRPVTPGGTPIPLTVVEKIDPESPSLGDIPGTPAHKIRIADAVPDMILKVPEPGKKPPALTHRREGSNPGPIPRTVISRVDSEPAHGEVPRTDAFDMRMHDAEPDSLEKTGDVPSEHNDLASHSVLEPLTEPGSPTTSVSRSPHRTEERRKSSMSDTERTTTLAPAGLEDGDEGNEGTAGFGDDFDDFEEGGGEDDFGDFDDGFEEAASVETGGDADESNDAGVHIPLPTSIPSFPLLDCSNIKALDDMLSSTSPYLASIFPQDPSLEDQPSPEPIPDQTAIFTTDRSLSLWNQLVTPPPLQPPNWIKSRIRRLFLVSLGVPVDLDEILPASKQQKLILPSVHLTTPDDVNKLKNSSKNPSSTSVNSDSKNPSKSTSSRRRRGSPPPPEWDSQSAKLLCATTDAALSGMTDEELVAHVKKLEEFNQQASVVLEYWLKQKDDAVDANETYMMVLENSVKHFRKIRK